MSAGLAEKQCARVVGRVGVVSCVCGCRHERGALVMSRENVDVQSRVVAQHVGAEYSSNAA